MILERDRQRQFRTAASGARAAGDRSDAGCEGRGDRHPAAPADGVKTTGRPAQVHALGSADAGTVGEAVTEATVVGVPGSPGHAPALAPGPGPPPLDLPAPAGQPTRL